MLDIEEPERVADATKRMNLRHVVITRVNRDELPEGASQTPQVKLPEQYNTATQLVREVTSGTNIHDFDLTATVSNTGRR